MIKAKKRYRVNRDIRAPKVRVIDENGEQAGVMPIRDALEYAAKKELDLVEVVPKADPPVCKVMDRGKHLFKISKQKAAAKKKQKQQKLKQLRIKPSIGAGDYKVKIANAKRFLEEGNKVEFDVRFRGREMIHREFGIEILKKVQSDLEEIADVEQEPSMQGRQMMMIFVPKKKK